MNVRNEHLDAVLYVTFHARQRWSERGTSTAELSEWLAKALPFGGQLGNQHQMLAFNDVVFVVMQKPLNLAVTTVLTKDQAMANLQAYCWKVKGKKKRQPK